MKYPPTHTGNWYSKATLPVISMCRSGLKPFLNTFGLKSFGNRPKTGHSSKKGISIFLIKCTNILSYCPLGRRLLICKGRDLGQSPAFIKCQKRVSRHHFILWRRALSRQGPAAHIQGCIYYSLSNLFISDLLTLLFISWGLSAWPLVHKIPPGA